MTELLLQRQSFCRPRKLRALPSPFSNFEATTPRVHSPTHFDLIWPKNKRLYIGTIFCFCFIATQQFIFCKIKSRAPVKLNHGAIPSKLEQSDLIPLPISILPREEILESTFWPPLPHWILPCHSMRERKAAKSQNLIVPKKLVSLVTVMWSLFESPLSLIVKRCHVNFWYLLLTSKLLWQHDPQIRKVSKP